MKGLLYKEFYLGRKTYFSFLALSLVFALLGVLVCLSMICGNLQYIPVKEPEQVQNFACIFTYLPFLLLLFSVNGSNQSIYSDYASGWMQYSYTLPTKAEKAVGVRYLTGMIIFGICFLYGMGNAWLISALTGMKLNAEVLKNMLVFLGLGIVIYMFNIPLALKYKTSRAVSARGVIAGVIIYIVCGVKFIREWNHFKGMEDVRAQERYVHMVFEKYQSVRDLLLPFLPLLFLMLFGISFFFSVRIYKRREKNVRASL